MPSRESFRPRHFLLQSGNLRIQRIFTTNIHGRIPELLPPVRQSLQRTAQRIEVIINIRSTPTGFLCQCRHGYPCRITGPPLLSKDAYLLKLSGSKKMQLIVQRLRGIYRIILQPLKLIYGITDRLANRSLHLCGSSRHHTDIVSTKCTTPHHLSQRTGCSMLRDTIPGNSTTERPQLPGSDSGIMPRQRQLAVKFFPSF